MPRTIFRKISCPARHAGLPINEFATWHSWSEAFLQFLTEAKGDLDRLSGPPLIRISGSRSYNRTFSWPADAWSTKQRIQRFASFAHVLPCSSSKVMFFDSLFEPGLSSAQFHALFAVLRGTLASLSGNELLAMYSPLGDVGRHRGAFPLHADLYIPQNLLNVFDDVPKDDTGASIFLPFATFSALLPTVRSLPERVARKMIALFCSNSRKDGFDALYDLLYGQHPWALDLGHALEQRQLRIKLGAGQGYLLNDRYWLHGREAPRGGVSACRVHRLVYEAVEVGAAGAEPRGRGRVVKGSLSTSHND